MTFTTMFKEEISKNNSNIIEAQMELEGFLKCLIKSKKDIVLTLENAAVARKIYKDIKMVFNIKPLVTIRIQKRFRVKQIYILTISEKKELIRNVLNIDNNKITAVSEDEKVAFLQGAFLAIGNVSNPQTSGYHLEYICAKESLAKTICKLLNEFDFNAKIVNRGYKFVVYLKSGENISDLIKMFKANNALFFFEDIRIYRDHKNMVNRLNNCEISNQVKSTQTGLKQLEDIKYLEDNDLISLLEDNTKTVIEARKKYPEVSLSELANIITIEYGYVIGKSGVNHHFIKITNMVKRHRSNNECK